MRFPYADLLHMPHPVPRTRPRMSSAARAAQFAPFAALTGFDTEIIEAARLTDERLEPCDDQKAALNERLQRLQACLSSRPTVTVTYFIPDARKSGGRYATVTGVARKVDADQQVLVLADGTQIGFAQIVMMEMTRRS